MPASLGVHRLLSTLGHCPLTICSVIVCPSCSLPALSRAVVAPSVLDGNGRIGGGDALLLCVFLFKPKTVPEL